MEGIDRLTWKIALQLCQDVYGTILRANLEKFHDVMDILEKGDVLLPLKLFSEIVTTPFRFIVFVFWLHQTFSARGPELFQRNKEYICQSACFDIPVNAVGEELIVNNENTLNVKTVGLKIILNSS